MKVPFSYLDRQFADIEPYLDDIRTFVKTGAFTLGEPLEIFERRFAEMSGVSHAIGVANGTDALAMSLEALGVGPGDEVITVPNTFVATVGAIVMARATPVFVDTDDGFVMDPSKIEKAITSRTKAILPVHLTGNAADMPAIIEIARRHRLICVEDSCQALGASIYGKPVGSWGDASAYSLHPLKNLNVWGDGGVIVTNQADLASRLRLLRNHGLKNRDEVDFFGRNSRLDTLQAVIANRQLDEVAWRTERRFEIANRYDVAFSELIPELLVPLRRPGVRHVFHLYVVRVLRRDELLRFLNERGIEAKIHYPIPIHMQKAASVLGYVGSFPRAKADAREIITLPSHPYLTDDEVGHVIKEVRKFWTR